MLQRDDTDLIESRPTSLAPGLSEASDVCAHKPSENVKEAVGKLGLSASLTPGYWIRKEGEADATMCCAGYQHVGSGCNYLPLVT